MYYPRELFNKNESITAENLRKYREFQEKVWNTVYRLYSNFSQLNLREKHDIVKCVETQLERGEAL